MARLCKEFYSLSKDERMAYMSQGASRDSDTTAENPDEKYSRLIGNTLFGLSSREEAFLNSELKRVVQSIVPKKLSLIHI